MPRSPKRARRVMVELTERDVRAAMTALAYAANHGLFPFTREDDFNRVRRKLRAALAKHSDGAARTPKEPTDG